MEMLRLDPLITHMWTLRLREGDTLSKVTQHLHRNKAEARIAVSCPSCRSLSGSGTQEPLFLVFHRGRKGGLVDPET